MLDNFNREINYLRISVTDKCNLNCVYCRPDGNGPFRFKKNDILSFEQIEKIVKESVKVGINKIRLTGGEPLVRKNIEILVKKLSLINGINYLSMTTNGVLLKQKSRLLKENGLDSVNISFDTLLPDRYEQITRGGDISCVLQGIDTAINENLKVKINMVVLKDTTENEVLNMNVFCNKRKIKLQLINHFSLDIEKNDDYKYDRPPKCNKCNRIRLLSNGVLKPCLHSDIEYKIDFNDIENNLKEVILSKPKDGTVCTQKFMSQIGG